MGYALLEDSEMKKIFLPVILAFWAVWIIEVPAQTVVEATKVVRLHDEIGTNGTIPIVKCLDLEQRGLLLAFGGDDHVVRLWSVKNQKFISQLRGHQESVLGVTFSPDTTRLVTVAQDGQICFWNVQDGRLLHTLNEPVRGTRQITFQPDGSRFTVCGFDNNVRIYDSATYRLVVTLPTHGTNNETVAYSSDGSLLAAGGRTGVVRIWRTSDDKHLSDIEGDGRRVHAIAFSPDGTMLATGGEGPFITLWNPQNKKLIRIFAERPGKTFSLTFCGNDMLASGESDNMVRIWNSVTGQQVATLSGHTGTISTMTYEPKTQMLVTGSFDASVRFWSLPETLVPVATLSAAASRSSEPPTSPGAPVLLSVALAPPVMPVVAEPAEQIAMPYTAEDAPEETLPTTTITSETLVPQQQNELPKF